MSLFTICADYNGDFGVLGRISYNIDNVSVSDKPMPPSGNFCDASYFPHIAISELVNRYQFVYLSYKSIRLINNDPREMVYISHEQPSKLIDYLSKSPNEILAVVKKNLGIDYVSKSNTKVSATKEVTKDNASVKHLKRILRNCPSVTVTKPELMSVKAFVKQAKQELREKQSNMSECAIVDFLYNFRRVWELLNKAHNDKRELTNVYQYPETLEQYKALCLMQSCNTPFNSCQELDLRKLKLRDLKVFLGDDKSDFSCLNIEANAMYERLQYLDFCNGLCDRFFKLDDNGFICCRFAVYHDTVGNISLDNFYNTSKRSKLKIGNTVVSNSNRFGFYQGSTYKNDSECNFEHLELPL